MVSKKGLAVLFVVVVSAVACVLSVRADADVKSLTPPKNILLISDFHLNSDSTNTMQLSPSAVSLVNDLDKTNLVQLLNGIQGGITNGQIATPDCIIFLGDAVRHLRLTSEMVIADENNIFTKLLETFPRIPIFYVCGNLDPLKSNNGPFYDPTQSPSNRSPYTIAMNNGWSNGFLSTGNQYVSGANNIFPCLITEDTQNGYYAAYLGENLRLITLNTVMFMSQRVDIAESDAQNELTWFSNQLAIAAATNESVLIATHVPFGMPLTTNTENWVSTDEEVFLRIFKQFKGTIIGVLAGHTHMEEMRIIQDGSSDVGVLVFAAGMCTFSGNSPAFKTIYYGETASNKWALTDYETFSFIYLTNAVPPEPQLQKLYQFSEYYGPSSASSIIGALTNVTAEKMQLYYTAGNTNYPGLILYPENIYVALPRLYSVIAPWLSLLLN